MTCAVPRPKGLLVSSPVWQRCCPFRSKHYQGMFKAVFWEHRLGFLSVLQSWCCCTLSLAGVPKLVRLKVLLWEICHEACVNVFWFCRLLKLYVFLLISRFSKRLGHTKQQCLLWNTCPFLGSYRVVWSFWGVFQWVIIAFKSCLVQPANCALQLPSWHLKGLGGIISIVRGYCLSLS